MSDSEREAMIQHPEVNDDETGNNNGTEVNDDETGNNNGTEVNDDETGNNNETEDDNEIVEIYIEYDEGEETILCKRSEIPGIIEEKCGQEYTEEVNNEKVNNEGVDKKIKEDKVIVTEYFQIGNGKPVQMNGEIPFVKFILMDEIEKSLSSDEKFHLCQIQGCENRIIPKKPEIWEKLFNREKYSKKLKEYEKALINLRKLFKRNIQLQKTQSAFFCKSHQDIWKLRGYEC